jgi:hypothetical protein
MSNAEGEEETAISSMSRARPSPANSSLPSHSSAPPLQPSIRVKVLTSILTKFTYGELCRAREGFQAHTIRVDRQGGFYSHAPADAGAGPHCAVRT